MMTSDTAPVRHGEELDAARLSAWLHSQLPDANGLAIEQFPSGHSNLVYLIRTAGREYVLRRPPLGPVAPKAHDMAREFRVLDAVHPHFPEAPRVFLLCEDPTVAGATFFLMERRHGIVLRDAPPPEWAAIPNYQARVSEAFIDCLVRLQQIDVSHPKLAALGRPEGFLERQVRGWSERWQRSKTEDLPEMDRVIAWLQNIPPSGPPTLVHNDFKLDNVMLRPDASRVEAVLDWEMATLGDPLADLGLTLCYWIWASRSEKELAQQGDPHPATPVLTTRPGWYTRTQLIERYVAQTGRDVTHLPWHEVLGVFKLAVILQQIYYRFHVGQTNDERFRAFDRRVRSLVHMAAQLMDQNSVNRNL